MSTSSLVVSSRVELATSEHEWGTSSLSARPCELVGYSPWMSLCGAGLPSVYSRGWSLLLVSSPLLFPMVIGSLLAGSELGVWGIQATCLAS